MTRKIGFFIGSLRKDSYNGLVAKAIASLLPAEYEAVFIQIDDLPFYNPDFDDEGSVPESYTRFREQVSAVEGVVFVTPEYNRSVPAVLKNALDVGSRPYGASVWDGKPGLVVTASPGGIGGFGANHHLRQSLVFLNVLTLQQPEAYIGNVHTHLGEDLQFEEQTLTFFSTIVQSYLEFLEKLRK